MSQWPVSNRFVGRVADIQAIRAQFHEGQRLITVVGPPGIGKTRLAVEVAKTLTNTGEVSGIFCDLTDATDVSSICARLGPALSVPLTAAGGDPVKEIGHALARRGPFLLVLDCFETLVSCAASTIAGWVRTAPNVMVLITSRERLRLYVEVIYDLQPLSLPIGDAVDASEAVQLFVDRACAVRRDFVLDAANRESVSALAHELEGIPLAIELAAARLRVLNPVELLWELRRRRLDVLSGISGGTSARQGTLRRAIDWSLRLLEPWEHDAFAQCSVFRGGFRLEAALRVLDLAAHPQAALALNTLQALCDKSLVVVEEPPERKGELRYRMYLCIREVASELLLENDPGGACVGRHAAFYVDYGMARAAQVGTRTWAVAQAELALESDNLLAVVQRALDERPTVSIERGLGALLALDPLHWVRGPFDSHIKLLTAAIARPEVAVVNPGLLARALHARGRALRTLGRSDESLADLERAQALAEAQSDRRLVGAIISVRGSVRIQQGRLREALELKTLALEMHRATGDRLLEVTTLTDLGGVQQLLGNVEEARITLEQALRMSRVLGDKITEASVLGSLGDVQLRAGRLAEAKANCERAAELCRQLGDTRRRALFLSNLGLIEQEQGRYAQAGDLYEQALDLTEAAGHRRIYALVTGDLGDLRQEQGRLDEAIEHYIRALEILEEVGDRSYVALSLSRLAAAEIQSGRSVSAKERFQRAAEIGATLDDTFVVEIQKLYRLNLLLAEAASLHRGGQVVEARARRAEVRGAIAEARRSLAGRSLEARIAMRALERALAAPSTMAGRDPAPETVPDEALVVGPGLAWFRPPFGQRVDLTRYPKPRLILDALVERHLQAPGEGIESGALLAAAWPGETLLPRAAASRVHAAILTLRRRGLSKVLFSSKGTYALDPSLVVVRAGDAGF